MVKKMGNPVKEKSFNFSIRIVKLYKYLTEEKSEYILSKQLLRSGTSIGANVSESQASQSTPDFITKMHIAFKETSETKYWIELLVATDYLTKEQGTSLLRDCEEVGNLLASIIKTSKSKNEK
ncbi:MAG: four helix bundle protein [Ruminococcaceae bacterium]|nr:four helix bundle protein [Oscillospiraceae bacterium]